MLRDCLGKGNESVVSTTVSSIHINEFEFLLKKNGFTLYKKYENYYKQGIVEYAFNGLLPEKQNDCRLSQNVV